MQLKVILKNKPKAMKLFFKLLFSFIIVLILLVFVFISLMKTKSPFYYSTNKLEAVKNESLISTYLLKNYDNIALSDGILTYAIKKGIIFDKIQLDRTQLSIKLTPRLKNDIDNKDIYWEAFFKGKKLTAFEDKGFIKIIGIDKNMDTIILKPNMNEAFYVIKDKL